MVSLGSPFLADQTYGRPSTIPHPSALLSWEGRSRLLWGRLQGKRNVSHSPESLPLGKDPAEERLLNSFPGRRGGGSSPPHGPGQPGFVSGDPWRQAVSHN